VWEARSRWGADAKDDSRLSSGYVLEETDVSECL
jgi:hypothetical protein